MNGKCFSNFFVSLFLALFFLVAVSQTGCKETGLAKAEVTVVDSSGLPLDGVTVYLNSNNNNPPGEIEDKQKTDVNGKTYHEFELEAILQIELEKTGYSAPKENVHVIPGETATKRITMFKD